MWKICTKCGKHKALWAFYRQKNRELGVASLCKTCCIERDLKRYSPEYAREYRIKNKERIREGLKIYRQENKDKIKKSQKVYWDKNKDKRQEITKRWYKNNKELTLERSSNWGKTAAEFNKYKNKLTVEESPILAKDGISLEVKCRHCREYFIPTRNATLQRIRALNTADFIESSLYCSEKCKVDCPVYRSKSIELNNSVQRERIPQELRNEVLQRNDGMCEMCGEHPSEEVHHEKPVATHPHLQLDKENLWGLCEHCHYEVCHQLEGCKLPELKKKSVNSCRIPA